MSCLSLRRAKAHKTARARLKLQREKAEWDEKFCRDMKERVDSIVEIGKALREVNR